GLEEAISGTIQEYYGERGFVTAAVEGGQHRDPETVDRLESTLWIALVAGGFLRAEQVAQLGEHRLRLRSFTRGLPSVVEVVHRHGREDGDGFQMKDGFRNFSTIKRGQVVARDRRGDIRSDVDGMLILPSYQSSGDDGFFVGRRVRRIWLRISAIVRRLHLHRLLPLLPGVRQHPDDPMALVANPKITRWAAVKVFHLFGLRRYAQEGGCLVFRRRREQIVGGKSVSEP
ncbi:MAG: hypothetical protein OEN01_00005, partial [Candidatus Krumholzibacteria bacterium]|nr:hypothetical protein [Candidatus Krumholzibacteria bacterium]